MIGLDDKGIAEAVDRIYPGVDTYQVNPADRAIAKAQAKKIHKWGNERCMEHRALLRHSCPECWQELLKEAE